MASPRLSLRVKQSKQAFMGLLTFLNQDVFGRAGCPGFVEGRTFDEKEKSSRKVRRTLD